MKTARKTWTVRCSLEKGSSYGIKVMDLELRLCVEKDLVTELATAIATGCKDSTVDYYKKQIAAVREATGGTRYYDHMCRVEFELRFQTNIDRPEEPTGQCWYGCRLEGGEVSTPVATAIAKIAKMYDPTPEQVIDCLGARWARYVSDASLFVADPDGAVPTITKAV